MYGCRQCLIRRKCSEINIWQEQLPTKKELGGLHDGMRSAARSSVGKTAPAEYAPRRISFTLYNLQLLAELPRLDL